MRSFLARLRMRPLLSLLIVAGILRLGVVFVMDLHEGAVGRGFASPAACEFTGMAHGLLKTGTFTYFEVDGRLTPSAYQPPLYPFFFAAVFATFGDNAAGFVFVQLIQVLFGIATVWLTYRLGKEIASEKVAMLAAWGAALWPTLLYAPVEAHSVSLLIPLLLDISLRLVRVLRNGAVNRDYWFLGIGLGVGAMIRSEVVFALPVILVLLFLTARSRWGRPALVATVAVLVPTGLWVARNAHDLGRPVLTTTAAVNLWRGDGLVATGGSYRWNGEIAWDTPETVAAVKALPWSKDYELKQDGVYAKALSDYLQAHPTRPVELLPVKLAFFLSSDLTHPKGKSPLVLLPAVMAIPFLFIGLGVLWRKRTTTWPILLWLTFYLLVSLATFPLPRYRLNVEPLMILTAACGWVAFTERRRKAGA